MLSAVGGGGRSAAVTHLAVGVNEWVAACSHPSISPPPHHPVLHHRYPPLTTTPSGHICWATTHSALRLPLVTYCLLSAAYRLSLAAGYATPLLRGGPFSAAGHVWPGVVPRRIEKSASVSVEAPRGVCYTIFSNLERQPVWRYARWCHWRRRVHAGRPVPGVSVFIVVCLPGQGSGWGSDATHGHIARACSLTFSSRCWSWRLGLTLPVLSGGEPHLLTPCVRAHACCLCSCLVWPA